MWFVCCCFACYCVLELVCSFVVCRVRFARVSCAPVSCPWLRFAYYVVPAYLHEVAQARCFVW